MSKCHLPAFVTLAGNLNMDASLRDRARNQKAWEQQGPSGPARNAHVTACPAPPEAGARIRMCHGRCSSTSNRSNNSSSSSSSSRRCGGTCDVGGGASHGSSLCISHRDGGSGGVVCNSNSARRLSASTTTTRAARAAAASVVVVIVADRAECRILANCSLGCHKHTFCISMISTGMTCRAFSSKSNSAATGILRQAGPRTTFNISELGFCLQSF